MADVQTYVTEVGGQKENIEEASTTVEDSKTEFKKPSMPGESAEEAKFKSKYPNIGRPGGSDFLRKRLHKGQKYFDSGDYNVAKQTGKVRPGTRVNNGGKSGLIAGSTGAAIPTPASVPHRKTSAEVSKLAV